MRKKNQEKKTLQTIKRDREVEELKKSLKNENELTVLSTRSELLLNAEIQANCKLNLVSFFSSHTNKMIKFQYPILRHRLSQIVIEKIAPILIPTTFIIWMLPAQRKLFQSLQIMSPVQRLQWTLPTRMIFSTWTVMIWIFFSRLIVGVRFVFVLFVYLNKFEKDFILKLKCKKCSN